MGGLVRLGEMRCSRLKNSRTQRKGRRAQRDFFIFLSIWLMAMLGGLRRLGPCAAAVREENKLNMVEIIEFGSGYFGCLSWFQLPFLKCIEEGEAGF